MSANDSKNVLAMKVPIVGQKAATVHQVLITIIATCGCGETAPVILPNVAAIHICPGCGDQHFLQKMVVQTERPGEGGIDLVVGRLAKAPAPKIN